MTRLEVDGQSIEAQPGDSLLVAMLRAGLHPTGGGCLCLDGDCPHCLTTVDGVAYTRSCQVRAEAGMVVRRDHAGGEAPPLLPDPDKVRSGPGNAGVSPASGSAGPHGTNIKPAPAHHIHCDTVVIGQGDSGCRAAADAHAAGQDVITLDAREGQHVTGVYPGPLVVALDDAGRVLHVHPKREIVVATGAAEIQPVVPGSDLEGLMTARAAADLAAAGIDFGRIVSLGEALPDLPADVFSRHLPLGEDGWDLIRFEGRRRIEAVVVHPHGDQDAPERRVECDTAILGLGRQPRNALARMATDLPVRAVGSAAEEHELPPCPREGTVCPCNGVTVADLDSVWDRGFQEMELLKRATLAGTGACQGGVCLPYLRSFLLERGGRRQPAFTARPLNRQLTVRELAAGAHSAVSARSQLHDEHLRLGARMERAGGWWRPWTYPSRDDEYAAVRNRVSLGDLSSLGKMAIAGPDAEAFLERIVPTRVGTIRPGRCRYVVMLDERGYLLDDGMLCREAAQDDGDRFFLTSTSGGADFLELWLRDWAEAFGFDVRILNQTNSLAAINVTGPQAARLLTRAGAADLPGFGRHQRLRVAGIDCRVVRLSFTGELSYELHHAAADAVDLWRRLLSAGGDLTVRPHGLETLLQLRLEKGHIVIGQDTEYDSTPRRLGCEWAVDLEKADFVGRRAILRTNKQPPDRKLVALWMDEPPFPERHPSSAEGSAIYDGERHAGYVTSGAPAPAGERRQAGPGSPVLGWLYLDENGNLPSEVTIDGQPARRLDGPAYDPEGTRARVPVDRASETPQRIPEFQPTQSRATDLKSGVPPGPARLRPLEATRIAAAPSALDDLIERPSWPAEALALRLAPDELLLTARPDFQVAGDPHAIALRETGFSYVWLNAADADRFLDRECDWERPGARPAVAQGEAAGIPIKLWFETERTLILAPAPFAAAFQRRLSRALGHAAGGAA